MFNQSENKARAMLRRLLITCGCLFSLILLESLFSSRGVQAELANLKLVPAPEHYTELYFDNSLKLPTTITVKPIAFGFTIHNVEGVTEVYPYTISLVGASGSTKLLKAGSIIAGNGVAYYVPETITLPTTTPVSEIVVSLPVQNQHIQFWLGKKQ